MQTGGNLRKLVEHSAEQRPADQDGLDPAARHGGHRSLAIDDKGEAAKQSAAANHLRGGFGFAGRKQCYLAR